MGSLREAGASDYEVLGLKPDASEQEIENAFDLLVHGMGFRDNLPRRLWPDRLMQIHSAYATLRDPQKRRAYDDSLRDASGASHSKVAAGGSTAKRSRRRSAPQNGAVGSVLVGAGRDPATDSLITPPKRPRRGPTAANADNVTRDANDRERPQRLKPQSSRERADKVTDKPAREEATGQGSNDAASQSERRIKNRSFFQPRSVPVQHWATGAVVALGLGALLMASWPHMKREPFETGGSARPTQQINRVAPSSQPGAPTNFPSNESLSPQERAAAKADAAPASASLGHSADMDGSLEGPSAARQDVTDSAVAVGGSPQPPPQPATAVPTNQSAAAAQPGSSAPNAAAPVSSGPIAKATGTVVPPLTASRPIVTSVTTQPRAKAAAAPPTWIGGGPTDKDNRRGRYKGAVAVRFTVGIDGRLSNCTTAQSSGNTELDALTCRLLVERGRFTPATDPQGRPIASQAFATYVWGRGRRSNK